MAATPSVMIRLATPAVEFSLPDTVSGKDISLKELRGKKGTVIMFICNHCPFVKHVNEELVILAKEFTEKGISFIAISSNDAVNYPQDSPDKMKETALELGYPFPYLYDGSQEVAKAFDAACTPDFFVYDKSLLLVYRGQLDNSRPGNEIPVTGEDMRNALHAIIRNESVSTNQKPSIGCSIKWRKG